MKKNKEELNLNMNNKRVIKLASLFKRKHDLDKCSLSVEKEIDSYCKLVNQEQYYMAICMADSEMFNEYFE